MSVRTDKSLRQCLEKRRSRALGKLGGPRRKRTAFSPTVWTSWPPSQQTCLPQTVTPLSQPAGLWLSARASHLRAFVCWAGAVSGRLPGLGRLCSFPRLFSDGSLEAPGGSAPRVLGGHAGARPARRRNLICPWFVDPRGILAWSVPMVSVGFQELSGAGGLRTDVRN